MIDSKSFFIKKLIAAFAAAAVFAVFAAGGLAGAEKTRDGVGMDISGFNSTTFSGDPVDGSIFAEAELTVINIWQRWCGPCWAEMPYFQQLHEYYSETPEADVRIWGALYYGDNPSTIQQAIDFVAEHGYTWSQMLMCDELLQVAAGGEDTEYVHIPQTLIVDRNGVVRAQVIGKVDSYEELAELVEYWLGVLGTEYSAGSGDVDGNGEVNVTDALLAMRCSMGIIEIADEAVLRGDMNFDGTITATDAILILREVLGVG